MSDKPLARERKPIERVRTRLGALVRANAAPRCGARSKRTGKPCRGAAMPNASFMAAKARAAHAGGPRAQQAGKLETRLLLSRSQGRTVAPAGGNACAPLSAQLDLRPPRFRVGYGPHRTIYLTGIDAAAAFSPYQAIC
jgi:hypothetical protein